MPAPAPAKELPSETISLEENPTTSLRDSLHPKKAINRTAQNSTTGFPCRKRKF